MRRACAVTAAITVAVLTVGACGTAGADGQAQGHQRTLEATMHEIGTRGAQDSRAEFVEIANRGSRTLPLGGSRLLVVLHSHAVELARIPDGVLLRPGAVYLIASTRFAGGPAPDQTFSIVDDIPEVFTMTLVTPQGNAVDTVTTARAVLPSRSPAPRPHDGLCLKRVHFTGDNARDWVVARCTPGVY